MSDLPVVVLLGTASGLQAALLAVGLVLVFRANRFINFAQGQMGSVASASLAVLVFRFDAPYWVALPMALVLGAAHRARSSSGSSCGGCSTSRGSSCSSPPSASPS